MLTSAIIGAILRHALSAAGVALATSGYLSAGDAQTLIGAAATAASLGWSIVQKYRAHKAGQ